MRSSSIRLALALASLTTAVPLSRAALSFEFNFLPGSGFLDPTVGAARQAALNQAGNILGSYFTAYTANLTFDVGEENSPNALASAVSFTTTSAPGFYNSVVQEKILTGTDANGSSADGLIFWNFSFDWNVGPTNAPASTGQFNIIPTALHELTHTLGFGLIGDPDTSNFTIWAGLLTNRAGTSLLALSAEERAATITGGSSFSEEGGIITSEKGVYFAGDNAVEQFGGLVPVFSPFDFQDGSSLGHLGAYDLMAESLMNPFSFNPENAPLAYSDLEIAILKDLGYTQISATAIPEPAQAGLLVGLATLGLVLLPRRRPPSPASA
jgi:hypothetical protein